MAFQFWADHNNKTRVGKNNKCMPLTNTLHNDWFLRERNGAVSVTGPAQVYVDCIE